MERRFLRLNPRHDVAFPRHSGILATMSSSEELPESVSLGPQAAPGAEFTISEQITVEHSIGRGHFAPFTLEPGDIIIITAASPTKGVAFRCARFGTTLIIVSPAVAETIRVEPNV
jgi:hypothetical protein